MTIRGGKSTSTNNRGIIIGAIVAVIVALIGIVPALLATKSSSSDGETFQYQVLVLTSKTKTGLLDAKVIIEVPGVAPLDEFTDSNGVASFTIDSNMANKRARITVQADGHQRYVQNFSLQLSELPDNIQLDLLSSQLNPSVPTGPLDISTTVAPPTATVAPPTATVAPPTATVAPPTATVAPPTATVAPPTATVVPMILVSVTTDNYKIDAQSCIFESRVLICKMLITNLEGVDRFLQMINGGDVHLWDTQGVEHSATSVVIAGATGFKLYEGIRLLPNTPVSAEFRFQTVPPTVDTVRVLEIRTLSMDDLVFQLREIPVTGTTSNLPTEEMNVVSSVVEGNYKVEAQPCIFEAQFLVCKMLITNLEGVDRLLQMINGGNVHLWDTQGVEHIATSVVIAGATGFKLYEGIRLLPNTPVSAEFRFQTVPPTVDTVRVLEIRTLSMDDLVFQLHDIDIKL